MTQTTSQISTEPNVHPSELEHKQRTELVRKIEYVMHDASKPYFRNALKKHAESYPKNANTICDYIIAEITEINIKQSTKETKIKVLLWFSVFHQGKSFRTMTKEDILDYLNSLRKPVLKDQNQRWIGSYNCRQMIQLNEITLSNLSTKYSIHDSQSYIQIPLYDFDSILQGYRNSCFHELFRIEPPSVANRFESHS